MVDRGSYCVCRADLARIACLVGEDRGSVTEKGLSPQEHQGGFDPGYLVEVPVVVEQRHAVLHRNLGDQAAI